MTYRTTHFIGNQFTLLPYQPRLNKFPHHTTWFLIYIKRMSLTAQCFVLVAPIAMIWESPCYLKSIFVLHIIMNFLVLVTAHTSILKLFASLTRLKCFTEMLLNYNNQTEEHIYQKIKNLSKEHKLTSLKVYEWHWKRLLLIPKISKKEDSPGRKSLSRGRVWGSKCN